MDELQLIRESGQTTPLPDADTLAPARNLLLAAISDERAALDRAAPALAAPAPRAGLRQALSRLRPTWRLALAGTVTAGLAAVATGVLVTGPTELGGQVPQPASAAEILDRAAAAALTSPDVVPRDNQFVYRKTQQVSGPHEVWMSVDGTRDGLIRADGWAEPVPGCRGGKAFSAAKDGTIDHSHPESCTPRPAYRPDLPTTPDGVLAYLGKQTDGSTNGMAKELLTLAGDHWLRPATRAALFQAGAKIPGVRVVEHATDGAGRPGVGITWTTAGSKGSGVVIVFDADRYTLLGTNQSAVLEFTLVDQVPAQAKGANGRPS